MIRRFAKRVRAGGVCASPLCACPLFACLLFGAIAICGAAATGADVSLAAPSASAGAAPDLAPVTPVTVDVGVNYGAATTVGTLPASPGVLISNQAADATNPDGVAAIPLPPSTYPGIVGLATAAFSVWRYRRRRR